MEQKQKQKQGELRYTPQPQNRRASILWIGLFSLSVLAFAASFALPDYGGTVQMASVIGVVIAIFVAYKFCFSTYTYILTSLEGKGLYFLIEQTQGKRTSLICEIPLYRILSVTELIGAEKSVRGRYFTCVTTMGGGRYQLVRAMGKKEDILVKIEADEAFLAAFRTLLTSVQAARKEPSAQTDIEADE